MARSVKTRLFVASHKGCSRMFRDIQGYSGMFLQCPAWKVRVAQLDLACAWLTWTVEQRVAEPLDLAVFGLHTCGVPRTFAASTRGVSVASPRQREPRALHVQEELRMHYCSTQSARPRSPVLCDQSFNPKYPQAQKPRLSPEPLCAG